MNRIFEIQPHKTDSRHYMLAVAELWLGRWWWVIALPIATCFILAAIIDMAFAFVALMMLFIVIPMIMSFLYFYYALTPEAIMAMRNKRMLINPYKGITVTYEPADTDDSVPAFPPSHVNWQEITEIEYRNHDIMLHLTGSHYRFILIPYDAIGTHERQTKLADILSTIPHAS